MAAVRTRTLQAIRAFFLQRGYLETDTPVRLPVPAVELHIDAEPAGPYFLRTSPELHMKRLLVEGFERVFQLGPCFRHGERGHQHHPEFTMLEWYRAGADYRQSLAETRELVREVVASVCGAAGLRRGGEPIDVGGPWEEWSVRDLFLERAGWDPVADWDPDRFDLDLVNRIEPGLARNRPSILCDYPAPASALARLKPGNPGVAERWELYIGGMELANAFSELTDPAEQRARFERWNRQRAAMGRPVYALDEPFLAALERGLPPCSGVAFGVDRLVMLLTGATDIADVLLFRE